MEYIKNTVIISRHPASSTLQFIASKIAEKWTAAGTPAVGTVRDGHVHIEYCTLDEGDDGTGFGGGPISSVDIEVLASATAADVAGKTVWGNVPLHLASLAKMVCAVEFDIPPRGKELLTLSDMEAAGARISKYKVVHQQVADEASRGECLCPVCGEQKTDTAQGWCPDCERYV